MPSGNFTCRTGISQAVVPTYEPVGGSREPIPPLPRVLTSGTQTLAVYLHTPQYIGVSRITLDLSKVARPCGAHTEHCSWETWVSPSI
eukprot:1175501-Prorocentrum_minimum.AAC.1